MSDIKPAPFRQLLAAALDVALELDAPYDPVLGRAIAEYVRRHHRLLMELRLALPWRAGIGPHARVRTTCWGGVLATTLPTEGGWRSSTADWLWESAVYPGRGEAEAAADEQLRTKGWNPLPGNAFGTGA